MRPNRAVGHGRRGVVLFYVIVALIILIGFCSLAVDWGRVQVAKTELRRATDAAARAGAAGLSVSPAQARANAIAVAAANTVDGSPLVLYNADIDVGNWNNGVFIGNASPVNAIRIRASRSAARGNAVPLLFGQIIGRSTCDVTASAVSKLTGGTPSGFIGLASATFKNNAYLASYNSSTTTSPNHASARAFGGLGSNGAITGFNNNDLYGTATLGPSATISGVTLHGPQTTLSTPITKPTSPAWSPGVNPGGVPQNYTVANDTALPGGTYWFTSLTINKNKTLAFSSTATLYVNGNIVIDGNLRPTSLKPADLTIYQIGAHAFGDNTNNMDIVAIVCAPDSSYVAKNNMQWRGSALFNSFELKNNGDLYYDETLGPASGSSTLSLTK